MGMILTVLCACRNCCGSHIEAADLILLKTRYRQHRKSDDLRNNLSVLPATQLGLNQHLLRASFLFFYLPKGHTG